MSEAQTMRDVEYNQQPQKQLKLDQTRLVAPVDPSFAKGHRLVQTESIWISQHACS